jgi:hypothetical protein
MAGSLQRAAWLRQWRAGGAGADWRSRFVPTGTSSGKVRCLDCGRNGYDGGSRPYPWQVSCLIGHGKTCPQCGAPTHNLGRHLSCGSGHDGCCEHFDTNYRRLLRQVGADGQG